MFYLKLQAIRKGIVRSHRYKTTDNQHIESDYRVLKITNFVFSFITITIGLIIGFICLSIEFIVQSINRNSVSKNIFTDF